MSGPLTNRIDATSPHDSPPPKRRWRLVLDLHADTPEEVRRALGGIAHDLREGSTTVTSGGSDSGYHWELTDYGPEVTHDSYVAALDAWRAAERVER